jgi:hypothetical protein
MLIASSDGRLAGGAATIAGAASATEAAAVARDSRRPAPAGTFGWFLFRFVFAIAYSHPQGQFSNSRARNQAPSMIIATA